MMDIKLGDLIEVRTNLGDNLGGQIGIVLGTCGFTVHVEWLNHSTQRDWVHYDRIEKLEGTCN